MKTRMKILSFGFLLPGAAQTALAPLPEGTSYNLSTLQRGAKLEISKIDGDHITITNIGPRPTLFTLTAITDQAAAVLAGVGNILAAMKKETP